MELNERSIVAMCNLRSRIDYMLYVATAITAIPPENFRPTIRFCNVLNGGLERLSVLIYGGDPAMNRVFTVHLVDLYRFAVFSVDLRKLSVPQNCDSCA
jgi:hypothetical protein